MSMLTTTVQRLHTMVDLASSYSHALAHKPLLADELGKVVHVLTDHVDELGVAPLMARAAADDVRQAIGLLDEVTPSYSPQSFRSSTSGDIRRAIEHAVGHLR